MLPCTLLLNFETIDEILRFTYEAEKRKEAATSDNLKLVFKPDSSPPNLHNLVPC
jgi:hypothetical protein